MPDTNSAMNGGSETLRTQSQSLLLHLFKTLEEMMKTQRGYFDDFEQRFDNIEQHLQIKNESLAQCPERFQGDYDEDLVLRFICNTEMYKTSRNISDSRSLQDFPHLLVGHAYDWWLTQKDEIKTWPEAMVKLRQHFSIVLSEQAVCDELFRKPYSKEKSFEAFILEKKLLLARWPGRTLSKCDQLHMMYSLLPTEVREKVPRHEIKTMADLMMKIQSSNLVNNNANDEIPNAPSTNDTQQTDSTIESSSATAEERCGNECMETNVNGDEESIATAPQGNREPIIKVRRTEDLMPPQIKDECYKNVPDNDSNFDQKEEFIAGVAGESAEAEFHIDSDIMSQITDIIDDYNAEGASDCRESETKSSSNSQQESEEKQLPNINDASEVAESGSPKSSTPGDAPLKTQSKRLRVRCSYCRLNGHLSFDCSKKKSQKGKAKGNETNVQKSDSNNSNSSVATSTAAKAPDVQPAQAVSYFIAPAPASSLAENHVERTSMFIPPAEVPSSARSTAAKSKSASSPSPKCHQCGTVGYYRSICPNCSPIYFYKPLGGNNR